MITRKILAATTVLGLALAGSAASPQRASPHESVTATIDTAMVSITYGRPSMRGRQIFGALVPYGRVWCPGADEATVLDSTRDLQVGALRVPAGPHTIWMLPTAEAWTLVVSREPSGFHTRYHPAEDLGRVDLRKTTVASPVDQLTFAVRESAKGAGSVVMTWETTEVSAPFTVVP